MAFLARKLSLQVIVCSLFFVLSTPLFAASPMLQEKLGVEDLDIIKDAKFVTLLVLVPKVGQKKFSAISESHLNNEEIKRLKYNILKDSNYDFEKRIRCHFIPEISLKFQDGKDNVLHLFVSPGCHEMLFTMRSHSVMLNYNPSYERLDDFFQELINETRGRSQKSSSQ